LLVNGETVVVEKVQHEILERPITVYNLEVEDNHNYFVAENTDVESGEFVLVHNVGKCTGFEGGQSRAVGDVGQYKNVRVDYQPKNANKIHVQWDSPKMLQHAYPWNNAKGMFDGLSKNHPINTSKAITIAKKLFDRYVK
jgi:hypothetical protein